MPWLIPLSVDLLGIRLQDRGGVPSSSGRKDSSRCRSSRTSAASGTSEQIQAAESEKERYANARRPECFLSMQRIDGERRIDIAKSTLTGLVNDVPSGDIGFAFRVFGHKEADSCRTDLEMATTRSTARLRRRGESDGRELAVGDIMIQTMIPPGYTPTRRTQIRLSTPTTRSTRATATAPPCSRRSPCLISRR